jgi:hypothetical protein
MSIQQIEAHCEELAAQVVPAAHLAGFNALDLESKLTGICVLAKIGEDEKVYRAAWNTLQQIKGEVR